MQPLHTANCNPRSPNPLAQRGQSSHWLTWKRTLQRQEPHEAKLSQPHPSHRRSSPHRRREPLCARKHMVSCDFQRPNISLTQQFHRDQPAMPCKSHYNCFPAVNKMHAAITVQTATQDHQTHWHSAVNHLIDWLESALYHGRSEMNAKLSQLHPSCKQGSVRRRRESVCAKKTAGVVKI